MRKDKKENAQTILKIKFTFDDFICTNNSTKWMQNPLLTYEFHMSVTWKTMWGQLSLYGA